MTYKDHLSKLEKGITTFLNAFEPGNLLHISKLRSYKNKVAVLFVIKRLKALKQLVWRLLMRQKEYFRLKDMLNFNVL